VGIMPTTYWLCAKYLWLALCWSLALGQGRATTDCTAYYAKERCWPGPPYGLLGTAEEPGEGMCSKYTILPRWFALDMQHVRGSRRVACVVAVGALPCSPDCLFCLQMHLKVSIFDLMVYVDVEQVFSSPSPCFGKYVLPVHPGLQDVHRFKATMDNKTVTGEAAYIADAASFSFTCDGNNRGSPWTGSSCLNAAQKAGEPAPEMVVDEDTYGFSLPLGRLGGGQNVTVSLSYTSLLTKVMGVEDGQQQESVHPSLLAPLALPSLLLPFPSFPSCSHTLVRMTGSMLTRCHSFSFSLCSALSPGLLWCGVPEYNGLCGVHCTDESDHCICTQPKVGLLLSWAQA